jgi:hypothetical protein
MTAWATVDDVFALTGVQTTPDIVTQANGIIELYSGATGATAANLATRDQTLMKGAVAYQAGFMASQVDVPTRMEVGSASQDGSSFTVKDGDALVIAPLAKRSMALLSWRRPYGTVKVRCGQVRYPTFEAWAAAWLTDTDPTSEVGSGWLGNDYVGWRRA